MYKKSTHALTLLAISVFSIESAHKRVYAPLPGQVEAENIEDENLRHRMMIEARQNAITNAMLAQRREREEALRKEAYALSNSASNLLRSNSIEDINQMVTQLEEFATEFSSVSVQQAHQLRNQARLLRSKANQLANLSTSVGTYVPQSSRNLLQFFENSRNLGN